MRRNLINGLRNEFYSSPLDGLISFIIFGVIGWMFWGTFHWLIFVADWTVVTSNLNLYIIGSYPTEEAWRPQLWILLLTVLVFLTILGPRKGYLRKALPIFWVLIVPFGLVLLAGGIGLIPIASRSWGGLALTLILTIFSACIALPLGVILAIGRQSKLVFISGICRIYIDVMRSVPLIAVLFFGQLLIPLFLPMDLEINRVLRAIFAFALFTSSYIAEDIRSGLQSIPNTQKEAAKVLGLNPLQTLKLIILPQAFRTALPALTNQIIGLLQNTSLMAILGLVELLGISRSLLANPEFLGRYLEVYIWIATIYWLVCTLMALLSRHIENQLNPINNLNN